MVQDIQANDANENREGDERGGNDSRNAADVNVIDQPAGIADQVENANDPWAFDAQGDRGDQFGQNHKAADRAVPGQGADHHEHRAECDLEGQGAFSLFNTEIVTAVGKAAGKIGEHSGIAAKQ